MTVYHLDPLQDPRWVEFIGQHPGASIFHTPGWLKALHHAYGYEPLVLTTSAPNGELRNGVLFCQVRSWLTGARLVSLPFSDHCEPLVNNVAELEAILGYLQKRARGEAWKYVELRPICDAYLTLGTQLTKWATYDFHKIDLRPAIDSIYLRFHESCIRRKIRRAEREQLTYETGRSQSLLEKFRYLLLLTRRRHRLPPQPAAWFQNLTTYLGDQLMIRVASKDDIPIASVITLSYKKSIVYKYGCSNAIFHNLGGTSFLFWKAIQEGKQSGAEEFDLGRSGLEDPGLVAFKEHLGGAGSRLNYYRFPDGVAKWSAAGFALPFLQNAFARMPEPIFATAGRLLYKHLG
jgi:Acetyltransferase (GNAT) domain